MENRCSKKTCCTIQYGEDAGVCMLDNCSCHKESPTPTPPTEKCCFICRCEEDAQGMIREKVLCLNKKCSCHTTDKGLELNWKALATKKLLDNGFAEKTAAEAVIALEKIVEYRQKKSMSVAISMGSSKGGSTRKQMQ